MFARGGVAQHGFGADFGGQGIQCGGAETLGADALGFHASAQQRLLGGFDHGFGAAHKHLVHAAYGQKGVDDGFHFGAVDAAFEQRHFLRLAREHMDQSQARGVAVFQVLQGFVEHHAVHAAVAIDQGEFAVCLVFQGAGQDRQDGRDARASRKTHAVDGAGALHHKTAIGRHHAQRVARLELGGRPVGEHAAFHGADAHFEHTVLLQLAAGRADGVAAAHIRAVDVRTQGQELARLEVEAAAQIGGHVQRDRHGTSRFGVDACDREVMESGCGHGLALRRLVAAQ